MTYSETKHDIPNPTQPAKRGRPAGYMGKQRRNIEKIFLEYHAPLVSLCKHKLIALGLNSNEASNVSEDVIEELYKRMLSKSEIFELGRPEVEIKKDLTKLLDESIRLFLRNRNAAHRVPNSVIFPAHDNMAVTENDLATTAETIKEAINNKYLKQLNHRKQIKTIQMRFGLPPYLKEHTLEETAGVLGLTRERIRQLEARALTRLQRFYELDKFNAGIEAASKTEVPGSKEIKKQELLRASVQMIELDNPYMTSLFHNIMKFANIRTIGDLASKTELDLLRIKDLGRKTVNAIKKWLEKRGLELTPMPPKNN